MKLDNIEKLKIAMARDKHLETNFKFNVTEFNAQYFRNT